MDELSSILQEMQNTTLEELFLNSSGISDFNMLNESMFFFNVNEVHSRYETYTSILSYFIAFLALCGIPGNVLIIVSVVRNKNMQTQVNILLTYLAVNDALFLIGNSNIILNVYTTFYGNFLCKFSTFFSYVTLLCGIWTLVIISYARYRAVCHPLSTHNHGIKRRTIASVIILSCVVACMCSPSFSLFYVIEYELGQNTKSFCMLNQRCAQYWDIAFLIVGFIMPVILISFFYSMVLMEVRSKIKQRRELTRRMRTNSKINRLVIVTTLAFITFWLPFHIYSMVLLLNLITFSPNLYGLNVFFLCLYYCNSCINPFLYGFMSKNFRNAFKMTLCGKGFK